MSDWIRMGGRGVVRRDERTVLDIPCCYIFEGAMKLPLEISQTYA